MIQGITEFLPVSSSGHLVVAQHLFGLTEPQLLLDVMLHLGTLLAVIVVFRSDITGIVKGIQHGLMSTTTSDRTDVMYRRLFWLVVVATLPTVVVGLLLKDFVDSLFGSPILVGCAFLATGGVLWISRFAKHNDKDVDRVSVLAALLIGISQALAITPGISRSGTTISVALLLGMDRGLAGRFSFLMAIPAIAGAAVLQLRDATDFPPEVWPTVAIGTLVAAVSGYVALRILMRIVTRGNFSGFAYYCWGIGILTLSFVADW
ncbi:MAG: undecaprenyl-diphosphate phosphatase [Candidatus Latescibacteria bacterium]|nr:undecaprenyl-diphosphate phosphatase [Candidatus Latescibacterota bacterium]